MQNPEAIAKKKQQQQKILEEQQAAKAAKLAEKQQEIDPLRQKVSAAQHLTPAQWEMFIAKYVPTAKVEHDDYSTTSKIVLFPSIEESNKYGVGENKIKLVMINGDTPLFIFLGVGSVVKKKETQKM